MFYNDMEIDLLSEAHAGEEERNGELSERSQVLQLIVSPKGLLKLITMQQSCPLRYVSVLMAKLDLSYKHMGNCQDYAAVD